MNRYMLYIQNRRVTDIFMLLTVRIITNISLVLVMIVIFTACRQEIATFDVVLEGGRVIDPESGLDAVRNIGIRGDSIAVISTEGMVATRTINAKGLVVAPGFIDLHRHLHTPDGYQIAALDGITMALDLEGGVPDIKRFLKVRIGKTPIHFGASASHIAARVITWGGELKPSSFGPGAAIPPPSPGPITNEEASPDKLQRIVRRLQEEMEAGALGIGMGLEYTPGATRQEVIEVFRIAAAAGAPVFVHARSAGIIEPGSSIEALTELIGAAAISGASLHIAHINSTCLQQSLECMTLIEGAIARGLDVTTETYPYTVAMAPVNSTFFDPGWQQKRGIDYADLELPDTGENLTNDRFEQLRASVDPIFILIHLNPEEVVSALVEHPYVIIASDALDGHPRAAGTYARILGKYVRTQGTLDLSEALRKISYLPALRLEKITSLGNRLGRVQVGAQADLVVFNAETVKDRATFTKPLEPSIGVQYLLVAGKVVVDQGEIVKDTTPGRPVIRDIF